MSINIIAGSLSFFPQGIKKGEKQAAPDVEFGGTTESFQNDVRLLNDFCANVLEPAMVPGDTQFSRRLPKESKLVADLRVGEGNESINLNALIDALTREGLYNIAVAKKPEAEKEEPEPNVSEVESNMAESVAVEKKLAGVLQASQRPAHVTFESKMPRPDSVIIRLNKGEIYYTEDETEHFLTVKGKNVNIDGAIIASDVAWPHVKNFISGAIAANQAGVEINIAAPLIIDTVTTFVNSSDELEESVLNIRATDIASLHSIKHLQDTVDFSEVAKFDNTVFRQQLMSIVSYNMGGVSVRSATEELPVHAFGVVEFELSAKKSLAYVFQGSTCMIAYTHGKKSEYSDVTTIEGLRSCAALQAGGDVCTIREDRGNQYRLLGVAFPDKLMVAIGNSEEWEIKPAVYDTVVDAWNRVANVMTGHVSAQASAVRDMLNETVEMLEAASTVQLEAFEEVVHEYFAPLQLVEDTEEEPVEQEEEKPVVEEKVETTDEEEEEEEEEEQEKEPESIDYLDMKPAELRTLVVKRGIMNEETAKSTPPADLVDMLNEFDEQIQADVALGEAIENRMVELDRTEIKKLISTFNQSELAEDAGVDSIKVLKADTDEALITKLLEAFDNIDDLADVCELFGWEDLLEGELNHEEVEDEDDEEDDWIDEE